MLPKLGRLLFPGETFGREPNEGELTLGRETEGRLISGLEPALKSGRLPIPIEGREIDGLDPGSVVGRLLTLGSEGRLDGIEMLGREAPPPLGREILGLGRDIPPPLGRDTLGDGRDIPPLGRPPPPMPIDGLAPPPPPAPRPPPPPPPRPPPPRPCPQASGTSTKPDTAISRMPKAIEFTRRFMILTGLSLECGDLSPLWFFYFRQTFRTLGTKEKRRQVAALQSCATIHRSLAGRRWSADNRYLVIVIGFVAEDPVEAAHHELVLIHRFDEQGCGSGPAIR